jgi:energy-coupling factor transporter transmembrane protein EcfT
MIAITITSLIWFLLRFIPSLESFFSKIRYVNHLGAGFGMPLSFTFLVFILICIIVRLNSSEKKAILSFLYVFFLIFWLVFDILNQFLPTFFQSIFNIPFKYNSDNPLQFAFYIIGTAFSLVYMGWYLKDESNY